MPLGGHPTRWTGWITGRRSMWSTLRIWRGICSPGWRRWSSFWVWRFLRTACSVWRARRTETSSVQDCGSLNMTPILLKCEWTLMNWSEQWTQPWRKGRCPEFRRNICQDDQCDLLVLIFSILCWTYLSTDSFFRIYFFLSVIFLCGHSGWSCNDKKSASFPSFFYFSVMFSHFLLDLSSFTH